MKRWKALHKAYFIDPRHIIVIASITQGCGSDCFLLETEAQPKKPAAERGTKPYFLNLTREKFGL